MLEEVMNKLLINFSGVYVDCTAGGGGHGEEILRRTVPEGSLIALDRDPEALKEVSRRLVDYKERLYLNKANFSELAFVLERMEMYEVDGVMFDLGVSSYQLDNPERGFSYMKDAPLDMRMDPSQKETAAYLIKNAPKNELSSIIKKYGEEKWASRIADFIVKKREQSSIESTGQLVEIIKAAIPSGARRNGPHPAKRTFQALRIAVNSELKNLEEGLTAAVQVLKPGGRLCVISFHSLEDRIVKNFFRKQVNPCECPPDFPQCVCGKKPLLKLINKRPITPEESELNANPQSRSAKLRVAEKL
ncbi:MAG: 16S rRNA (cytosine(1402)-N(4))-methyltransferase RsmH [Clostridiales bacterium]|nr:16S rRNA (cytosine(1402)-N(4))-methyltransferase RsmH [Clostridiales bacterium]MCF8021369.1 16S rRNA (cytosine(1402)-N(4))-methyltransferase RsmH [Clostridiales bacterium]